MIGAVKPQNAMLSKNLNQLLCQEMKKMKHGNDQKIKQKIKMKQQQDLKPLLRSCCPQSIITELMFALNTHFEYHIYIPILPTSTSHISRFTVTTVESRSLSYNTAEVATSFTRITHQSQFVTFGNANGLVCFFSKHINTLSLTMDISMLQKFMSSLLWAMAWCRTGTNPLPKPVMIIVNLSANNPL